MTLWDDEIEALRPALRREAAEFLATTPWNDADKVGLTVDERLIAERGAAEGALLSDRAVDSTIEGPTGPIRLRTLARDAPDGVLLHIHGGGWAVGTPELGDEFNERTLDACNVTVVSVDYRLAPEHPYPAGPDDCEAAACWLVEHAANELGSDRLLISGESAGAHLAAVTLLRMRDKHAAAERFVGANFMYGAYDLSRTPSQRGVGIPPGADILDGMEFWLDLFLPQHSDEQRRDPDVSPLFADLAGLPPALFSVGTHDHLVDDTLFMAARWQAAGNTAEVLLYPETPHGCTDLPTVDAHFFPRFAAFIRRCLATDPVHH